MAVPRYLERAVRLVLPPACREHVLGDLHERYRSPRSYVADALSVLGPVIIARIRRTTDLQVFAMESLTIYISFAMAAWYLGQERFLYAQAGFARLAVPTGVAAVVLLFSNAYSDPERKSWRRPILQAGGSIAMALLGQAVVFDLEPGLAVPLRTMLYGGGLAMILVSPLRALFPPIESRPRLARPRTSWGIGETWGRNDSRRVVRVPVVRQLRRPIGSGRPHFAPGVGFALVGLCCAAVFLLSPMWHSAFTGPRLMVLALAAVVAGLRIRNGH